GAATDRVGHAGGGGGGRRGGQEGVRACVGRRSDGGARGVRGAADPRRASLRGELLLRARPCVWPLRALPGVLRRWRGSARGAAGDAFRVYRVRGEGASFVLRCLNGRGVDDVCDVLAGGKACDVPHLLVARGASQAYGHRRVGTLSVRAAHTRSELRGRLAPRSRPLRIVPRPQAPLGEEMRGVLRVRRHHHRLLPEELQGRMARPLRPRSGPLHAAPPGGRRWGGGRGGGGGAAPEMPEAPPRCAHAARRGRADARSGGRTASRGRGRAAVLRVPKAVRGRGVHAGVRGVRGVVPWGVRGDWGGSGGWDRFVALLEVRGAL
ncbi:hypothetical protein T484DRAFT_1947817, partial [Baffinella frigidus]